MLEGLDAEPVRHELSVWKENFVNIQDLMDDYTQLKERSQLLRDEVCVTALCLDYKQTRNTNTIAFVFNYWLSYLNLH